MTRLELDELREEARLKYDHPTKPTPMLLNPRGVLALIARGDRLEAAGLLMERLLKRASEALYCGVRGVPLGRNAWELSGEIDFYLAAREEDRRSAAPPVRFPEEQLSKEGSAVAPVPGDADMALAKAALQESFSNTFASGSEGGRGWDVGDREGWGSIARALARVRSEERERIAASFERSAQMLFDEGNESGSREHRGFAASIRGHSQRGTN